MSGSGQEALLDIQEYPRMSVCGRDDLPDIREW